jgi:hypothetical protein
MFTQLSSGTNLSYYFAATRNVVMTGYDYGDLVSIPGRGKKLSLRHVVQTGSEADQTPCSGTGSDLLGEKLGDALSIPLASK